MLDLLSRRPPLPQRLSSTRSQRRRPLRLEELESRTLLTIFGPAQIAHAYGFDRLPYDGSGQTIAIVDAFGNPNVASDLSTFDSQFGLPDPVLTVVQPQGAPAGYSINWALETDLDVQWAHAIAPRANILLVESATDFFTDMLNAVDYARQQPGVVAVSLSWTSGEAGNESSYDYYFTTPAGHIGGSGLPGGVTFVAASGDAGSGALWPAASPDVLSIGGTTLTVDNNSVIVSETGWWRSGGGVSFAESQPSFQAPFQSTGQRTTPDFSYNADSASPYWIYDTYGYGGLVGVYGTSAGAPQWAALIALADQALAQNGVGSLDGATQTLPLLYNLASQSYSTYYNDIVSGYNGYQAGPGYDYVTGIGSPVADQVVLGLLNSLVPPSGGGARVPGGHRSTVEAPQATFVETPPSATLLHSTPGQVLGKSKGIPTLQGVATQTPLGLLLAALANPASGTVVANSSASAVTSPSSERLPLLPSTPAVLTAPAPLTSHVESGSSEGELIEDTTEDDTPDDTTLSTETARGVLPFADLPAAELPSATIEEATAACFASVGFDDGPGRGDTAMAGIGSLLGMLPDPLAAVGVMAIVLGGYWSRPALQPAAAERRRRDRFIIRQ